MRRFERPEVATKYGPCINCDRGTRSHVLEPALWESYEEEVIVGRSDDFAAKQWEDVDYITRHDRVEEATVMCHSCWLEVLAHYNKTLPTTSFDGAGRIMRMTKLIRLIQYYELEDHLDEEAKKSLNGLRSEVKGFLAGEEE